MQADRKRNHQLDEAVGKVTAWFEKKGFRSCILKGQGNALMYPCQGHRTAGDIDIWVSGKPSEVIQFVHSILPKEKASYHHIAFPDINGIPVEVHYRPCYLQNPLHNHRLQKYFRKTSEEQFCIRYVLKKWNSLYQQRDLILSINLSISTIICFKKELD